MPAVADVVRFGEPLPELCIQIRQRPDPVHVVNMRRVPHGTTGPWICAFISLGAVTGGHVMPGLASGARDGEVIG